MYLFFPTFYPTYILHIIHTYIYIYIYIISSSRPYRPLGHKIFLPQTNTVSIINCNINLVIRETLLFIKFCRQRGCDARLTVGQQSRCTAEASGTKEFYATVCIVDTQRHHYYQRRKEFHVIQKKFQNLLKKRRDDNCHRYHRRRLQSLTLQYDIKHCCSISFINSIVLCHVQ